MTEPLKFEFCEDPEPFKRRRRLSLKEALSAAYPRERPAPIRLPRLPKGCVYPAHPITTYNTCREFWHLYAIDVWCQLLGLEVVDVASRYPDSRTWRDSWFEDVRRIGWLVVFGEADGTVGAGVWCEDYSAHKRGIPVIYFAPWPTRHAHLEKLPKGQQCSDRFARIVREEQP